MVTDTIGDLIIRIKNANLAKKDSVTLYTSKMKEAICNTLVKSGFIKSAGKSKNGKMLEIELAYKSDKTPKITGAARISKPSRRVYNNVSDIKMFKGGFGSTIFSTPLGILSDKEAKKNKVGGEALFKIW